jgi:hypothetical protein
MKRFWELRCAGIFIVLFVISAHAEAKEPKVTRIPSDGEIRIADSIVSANLKKAPLQDVIREIKEQSKIWVTGNESLLGEKISVQFNNLTLEKSIGRILINFNHSIVYDEQEEVVGLFIVGKRQRRQTQTRAQTNAQIHTKTRAQTHAPQKPPVRSEIMPADVSSEPFNPGYNSHANKMLMIKNLRELRQ